MIWSTSFSVAIFLGGFHRLHYTAEITSYMQFVHQNLFVHPYCVLNINQSNQLENPEVRNRKGAESGPKHQQQSLSKVAQKALKSLSKVAQKSLKSFSKLAQSRSKVGQNVHHNSTVGAICPPSKSLCDLGRNVLGQNVLGAFCLGAFCPWGKMSLGQNVP